MAIKYAFSSDIISRIKKAQLERKNGEEMTSA